ncbi:DUF6670 family protein [Nocardia higoensis]|uniref:DUF6670 family protein n=1 Tax=Nocardia higoensis TaxID=228599 RepID=UPI000687B0F9|nr:DUF6670 family protein [Nocardia higoensis]
MSEEPPAGVGDTPAGARCACGTARRACPVYKHLGLLSRYEGHITLAGERQDVEGLCSFEYGACPSAHLLRDAPLPATLEAPLDHFVTTSSTSTTRIRSC